MDCGIVTMDQGAKLDFTSLRLATIGYYPVKNDKIKDVAE